MPETTMPVLSTSTLHLLAYTAALIATLMLAAFLTPSRWWRRPNVKALAVLVAGTWGIGSLLLAFTPERAIAQPVASPVQAITLAPVEQDYFVFEDLNVREAPGVGARRVALVPAGATVTTTGAREGDWWQVRTSVSKQAGWVSSLWLRRAEEASGRKRRQH
jgi:uncharacterized protein YgiM (DUF1202 family)